LHNNRNFNGFLVGHGLHMPQMPQMPQTALPATTEFPCPLQFECDNAWLSHTTTISTLREFAREPRYMVFERLASQPATIAHASSTGSVTFS
jgi:hypothetical protein